jgi:hypothetical protein
MAPKLRAVALGSGILALGNATHARAEGVTVGWDVEELVDYRIVRTHSTTHLQPVTVWLDDDGRGLSDPLRPEFHSNTALSGMAAQYCAEGALDNGLVQVEVVRAPAPDGGVRYLVNLRSDGTRPFRHVSCTGPLAEFEHAMGAASVRSFPAGVPFEARELSPGTPRVTDLKGSYPHIGPYNVIRDELTLTLLPCEKHTGASGDGSILFRSQPAVGAQPWPTTETHPSFKELNGGSTGKCHLPIQEGQTLTLGATKLDGEFRGPEVSLKEDPEHAQNRCFYFDSVTMTFPGIEMRIPPELVTAEPACAYPTLRLHEARHALDMADAMHTMQRSLVEYLASGALPSPGKPAYVHGNEEANRYVNQFYEKVRTLEEELNATLDARPSGVDSDGEFENAHCPGFSSVADPRWCR